MIVILKNFSKQEDNDKKMSPGKKLALIGGGVAEEQRRAEKEARERRQQAEAASREKEEQRRQEHLNQVKDRSQRKGLYTGLGIAGGVGAVGAGAYYLANRNNRRDDR